MKTLLFAAAVVLLLAFGGCTGCPPQNARPDAGKPVATNCGFDDSPGNSLGIGRFCTTTEECPVAATGTTIQCSTVLTDSTLPLLCSRLCGTVGQTDVDCGEEAVCHNIKELGYDLTVCVPYACDPLFDGGLPRPPR